jgi:hypothetical protein
MCLFVVVVVVLVLWLCFENETKDEKTKEKTFQIIMCSVGGLNDARPALQPA